MNEQITARPYHKNPRKISAQQVVQLREWLAELGDLGGIVHDLNSGEIISGNQRSFHAFDLAQCEIEITHRLEEPDAQGTVAHGFVVWQGGRYAYRQVRWTAEQCEKANIIANKAGGTWDIESLLSGFEREGLLAWGFSDEELDDLAEALADEYLAAGITDQESQDAEPQVNRAEDLRAEWGVETGQLWRLPSRTAGQEHRLICGDCTDEAVVSKVMGGERADMLADPPYGMNLDTRYAVTEKVKGKTYPPVIGDDEEYNPGSLMDLEKYENHVWFGADYYCWHLPRGGSWLVWDKKQENLDASIGSGFELIWCYPSRKKIVMRHLWSGFTAKESNEQREHPTQKPVSLICKLLEPMGEIIFDPFSGSGTTIIAAENLSRQCRAVEISPAYVAVALQRYQDAFGITPELIEDASW